MSKEEFLDTLRKVLARELSESEVADNINYYWNYIEQQIASGKTEEQVLQELGDPRLIARTILQVDREKRRGAVSGRGRLYRRGWYVSERYTGVGIYRPVYRCTRRGTPHDSGGLGEDCAGDCDYLHRAWHDISYFVETAAGAACDCGGLVDLPKIHPEIKYARLAGCEIYWKMLY